MNIWSVNIINNADKFIIYLIINLKKIKNNIKIFPE